MVNGGQPALPLPKLEEQFVAFLESITLPDRFHEWVLSKIESAAAELRAGWWKEAGDELPQLRAVVASATGAPPVLNPVSARDAMDSAVAHVFERRSAHFQVG